VPISDDGPDREVQLTAPQQQALEYLVDGGSIAKAAKFAGVSRQTIYRWIREDLDFRTVYDAWHREIQKSVKDRMAAIGDSAMDNLANAIRFKGNLRASEFVVKHLLAQKEK
jgi:IS30 family transposase